MADSFLVVDDAYAEQIRALAPIAGLPLPVRAVPAAALPIPWSTVLAAGAESGGTSPILTAGDAVQFLDGAGLNQANISYSSGLAFSVGGATRLRLDSSLLRVFVASIAFPNPSGTVTIESTGTGGNSLRVRSEPGTTGVNGGPLELRAGDGEDGGPAFLNGGTGATDGGDVALTAGQGIAGSGGSVSLQAGAGAAAVGRVRLKDSTGGTRLQISTAGVAFNSGSFASSPSVTGSRGGNAALADLLTKLAGMGLITDNTTA